MFGARGEKLVCHVSNFRPVKRSWTCGVFEKIIARA
jgi:hypothetical protein